MSSPITNSAVRLPGWAWWWLLLSSIVMAFEVAYLMLRPHSLPNGSLHRYFSVYDIYVTIDPSYADTHDPFTRCLAVAQIVQVTLNTLTLALSATLPYSAWSAILAIVVSTCTASITAFFFLFEAFSGTTGRYQLGDVSTWDAGFGLGYVCPTSLFIVFPLAIVISLSGQFARVTQRVNSGRSKRE